MENFTILLKKYADFIVRVGVNPQPGQTLVINCCLEAAPLARLCVRSAYEAGARDVLVNWSDNDVSRSRMELGSEEALSDFKSWQLRRYLDYAESEGGVCVLHILADDPEVYAGLDGAKISRVNAGQRKFMAPWREYTMNDRVQWSIAAMPSAPWAKKMFPELDEAAAIDGAGVLRTFWSIILPQLKPVTVSVIILKGVTAWNEYLYPYYILQKPSKYTLVLLIRQFFGGADSAQNMHGAAAAAVLCVLPLVVAYLCLQKYFIQGQVDSAVK